MALEELKAEHLVQILATWLTGKLLNFFWPLLLSLQDSNDHTHLKVSCQDCREHQVELFLLWRSKPFSFSKSDLFGVWLKETATSLPLGLLAGQWTACNP